METRIIIIIELGFYCLIIGYMCSPNHLLGDAIYLTSLFVVAESSMPFAFWRRASESAPASTTVGSVNFPCLKFLGNYQVLPVFPWGETEKIVEISLLRYFCLMAYRMSCLNNGNTVISSCKQRC